VLVLAVALAVVSLVAAQAARTALLKNPPAGLLRSNFRGASIPVVGGIVIVGGLVVAEGAFGVVALLWGPTISSPELAFPLSGLRAAFFSADHLGLLLVAVGFFGLGLIDDAAGAGKSKGFHGHLRALARGELTGGAIKLLGGAVFGLMAGGLWESRPSAAVLDGLLVALSANLVNLLDLRPGRAIKAFLLAWTPLALIGQGTAYLPLSEAVAAGAVAWLPADLGERGMLGDGGANLLGAVLGAGLALTLPMPGKVVALAVLIALTAASERWSFSEAIARVPPLRWLDRLGQASDSGKS
jgi:UDP-GlcNAc:undecaprenyl-phosphate GlcNAc-1-phosphate transferase